MNDENWIPVDLPYDDAGKRAVDAGWRNAVYHTGRLSHASRHSLVHVVHWFRSIVLYDKGNCNASLLGFYKILILVKYLDKILITTGRKGDYHDQDLQRS